MFLCYLGLGHSIATSTIVLITLGSKMYLNEYNVSCYFMCVFINDINLHDIKVIFTIKLYNIHDVIHVLINLDFPHILFFLNICKIIIIIRDRSCARILQIVYYFCKSCECI